MASNARGSGMINVFILVWTVLSTSNSHHLYVIQADLNILGSSNRGSKWFNSECFTLQADEWLFSAGMDSWLDCCFFSKS
jgi:hypothetical protein